MATTPFLVGTKITPSLYIKPLLPAGGFNLIFQTNFPLPGSNACISPLVVDS